MNDIIQFLIHHGYAFIFVWMFGEQMGVPVPAAPVLLATGALAGEGELSLLAGIAIALIAILGSNVLWYWIGRKKGRPILALLCRISFKPDSCIRGTAEMFARHGSRSLLFAKFVPGISTLAPPLAGIFHMNLKKFLLLDVLGSLAWVGFYAGVGYIFSDELENVVLYAERTGSYLGVILVGGLATIILGKYARRLRFLHQLRISRISPEELEQKMEKGEPLVILDVRHALEVEAEPYEIPGAIFLPVETMEAHLPEIPLDREIILYCN
jgi:membrane protein DedA with SNARE-associated domain